MEAAQLAESSTSVLHALGLILSTVQTRHDDTCLVILAFGRPEDLGWGETLGKSELPGFNNRDKECELLLFRAVN